MLNKVSVVAALVLWLAAAPAFAAATAWEMIPAESILTFSGKQMGAAFSGAFKKFTADIAFDENALAESTARIEVDLSSIDSGDAERDSAAKGADWLDIANHPAAVFESTRFTKTGDNTFAAEGFLSIYTQRLPVTLPFTLTPAADKAEGSTVVAKGALTLDRSAFQLGRGEWKDPGAVANEIIVDFTVTARRK